MRLQPAPPSLLRRRSAHQDHVPMHPGPPGQVVFDRTSPLAPTPSSRPSHTSATDWCRRRVPVLLVLARRSVPRAHRLRLGALYARAIRGGFARTSVDAAKIARLLRRRQLPEPTPTPPLRLRPAAPRMRQMRSAPPSPTCRAPAASTTHAALGRARLRRERTPGRRGFTDQRPPHEECDLAAHRPVRHAHQRRRVGTTRAPRWTTSTPSSGCVPATLPLALALCELGGPACIW